jgi:hypothetical protein
VDEEVAAQLQLYEEDLQKDNISTPKYVFKHDTPVQTKCALSVALVIY